MASKFLVLDSNKNPSSKYYELLSAENKKAVDDFVLYTSKDAGKTRQVKARTNIIRFLTMVEKNASEITNDDLIKFLTITKEAERQGIIGQLLHNDIKDYVQRFLRRTFKDWSERFNDFEEIRFNPQAEKKKKIEHKDLIKKEDVARLVKSEPLLYWKLFVLLQYHGGLRTIEVRSLRWSDIDDSDEDVYFLKVRSKKNTHGVEKERFSCPLDSEVVHYIKQYKSYCKENNILSPYLFYSKEDKQKFVSSGTVSLWFRRLTKRVFGTSKNNYLLRHSKGEELHELADSGVITEEVASIMMGHSKKMFNKAYNHKDNEKFKQLLKKQILNHDYLPQEKKHELELKVESLEEDLRQIKNFLFGGTVKGKDLLGEYNPQELTLKQLAERRKKVELMSNIRPLTEQSTEKSRLRLTKR